jgi:anaerobic sulfite reductase subunit C
MIGRIPVLLIVNEYTLFTLVRRKSRFKTIDAVAEEILNCQTWSFNFFYEEVEMRWTPEAKASIKKVPFFVRKKVRLRVEKEAAELGKAVVGIEEVKATQKSYLTGMASEIKGYQLDACFGPSGCPNRAVISDSLVKSLVHVLQKADLFSFLKEQVGENIKFHHEFRVSVADCPNACSQPQIKDIGIIGAIAPGITEIECTQCGECLENCPDDALVIVDSVSINQEQCMACGKCISVCPNGVICENVKGYRVLLGGKLGRHPQLAREIPGIFNDQEVLQIVEACLDLYKNKSKGGKRFAEILTDADFNALTNRFPKTQ